VKSPRFSGFPLFLLTGNFKQKLQAEHYAEPKKMYIWYPPCLYNPSLKKKTALPNQFWNWFLPDTDYFIYLALRVAF